MHTTCPDCGTQTLLTARDLRDGQGRVQCERCSVRFDALKTLEDDDRLLEVPEAIESLEAVAQTLSPDAEGQVDPPDTDDADESAEFGPSVEAQTSSLDGPGSDTDSVGSAGSAARADRWAEAIGGSHDIDEPGFEAPEFDDAGAMPFDLEHDLRAQARSEQSRARTGSNLRAAGLLFVTLCLLAGLGVQYVWFHAGEVSTTYPGAAAYVERFCAFATCTGAASRDPAAFKILSRDVRVHPRYPDALELSASFAHGAPRPQAYPYIQFTLFDVAGYVTAQRVFAPSEYLTSPPHESLARDEVVEVSLDLLAPEQAPLSFEIKFL